MGVVSGPVEELEMRLRAGSKAAGEGEGERRGREG